MKFLISFNIKHIIFRNEIQDIEYKTIKKYADENELNVLFLPVEYEIKKNDNCKTGGFKCDDMFMIYKCKNNKFYSCKGEYKISRNFAPIEPALDVAKNTCYKYYSIYDASIMPKNIEILDQCTFKNVDIIFYKDTDSTAIEFELIFPKYVISNLVTFPENFKNINFNIIDICYKLLEQLEDSKQPYNDIDNKLSDFFINKAFLNQFSKEIHVSTIESSLTNIPPELRDDYDYISRHYDYDRTNFYKF